MPERERIGARGSKEIADLALAYTESTSADGRMVAEDIWGSQAHAIMLACQGILAQADLRETLRWLEQAREDLDAGRFTLDRALEDVHMNVENYIRRGAGPEGARAGGGRAATTRRVRATIRSRRTSA
jgi:argininosuccinate lyase